VSRALAVARDERDHARQERDHHRSEAARLSGLLFHALDDDERRHHGEGI